MLRFVPPTGEHIEALAAGLSDADRAELAAGGFNDPEAEIADGVLLSAWSVAALDGDDLLCIFGVAPLRPHLLLEDVGVPWLLGTDAMRRHRRKLITTPAFYIPLMLDTFPTLMNTVHADNRRAVRWLQRLGFSIEPAVPCGPRGALFHRFTMTRAARV